MINKLGIILKKLIFFLRDQGVVVTVIKTYEYLSFKIIEKKNKRTKPLLILKDDITVITNFKGVSLMVAGKFITNSVGFYSAIKNLEKWHDSTQAEFKFVKKSNSLIIQEWWWNLPLKYNWIFTLKENSIIWKGSIVIENCIMVEEMKVGLIVNNIYDSLILDQKIFGLTKKNFQWQETTNIKRDSLLTLGVKDNPLNFPNIQFNVVNSLYPCKTIVQNTDNYLNGRLLQAVMEGETEYLPGKYDIFELEISIIKK